MKLPTFAAAAAAAALTVALGAPMANAAVTHPAAAPTAASDEDCYYTHHYNGFWHPHARLVCDYDPDFDHDYYVAHPEFRGHMDHDRMGDRSFRDHDNNSRDNNRTDGRDAAAVNNATPTDRTANTSSGDPSADRRSAAEKGDTGASANTPAGSGNAGVQPRR